MITRKSKIKPKRRIDSDTDSDLAEQKIEKEALSPRTRRSITGVRPRFLTESSDDEDTNDIDDNTNADNDYNEKECDSSQEATNNTNEQSSSKLLTDDENDDYDIESETPKIKSPRNKSTSTPKTREKTNSKNNKNKSNDSFVPQSIFSENEDEELHSYDPEGDNSITINNSNTFSNKEHQQEQAQNKEQNSTASASNTSILPDMKLSSIRKTLPFKNRKSSVDFNMSIRNKFSSTMFENQLSSSKNGQNNDSKIENSIKNTNLEEKRSENLNESSVIPITNNSNVIEINSSSESSSEIADSQIAAKPKNAAILQPKITAAFDANKQETINKLNNTEDKQQQQKQQVPVTALQRTKVVSKDYFHSELEKLQRLKNELSTCQHLITSVGSNLPGKY